MIFRESHRWADASCYTADTAPEDNCRSGPADTDLVDTDLVDTDPGIGQDTGLAPSRQIDIAATELFPASCSNNDAFFDSVGYERSKLFDFTPRRVFFVSTGT
jgi:hypothetical protein